MADLNSVQSGSDTLGAGAASKTVTISSVDTSKTFIVVSCSPDTDRPERGQISWELTDATTITIFRNASAGGAITFQWYASEFSSGVVVQRGTQVMDATTENVTISSVTLNKSFVLSSADQGGGAYSADDFTKSRLTTSTNLELTMDVAGNASTLLKWQVIEFTGASVQTGEVAFTTADSSKTATITSIDTGKSLLIHTQKSADGTFANIGQKMIRGVITNSTTLTFDRDNTGQTMDLTWFLVEFTDGTIVQHASEAFTSGQTQKDVTISAVVLANSIALAGGMYHRGGKTPYSANDNTSVGSVECDLTTTTNLQLTRSSTGSVTCDIGWFVVEFNAAAPSGVTPYIGYYQYVQAGGGIGL